MSTEDERWAKEWARSQGAALDGSVQWQRTASGATLGFSATSVVKVHSAWVDPDTLAGQLGAAASAALSSSLVAPLTAAVGTTPHDHRAVTLWPRVAVLDPAATEQVPWDELGAHLAGLHRATGRPGVRHGGPARVRRSLERVAGHSSLLHDLGQRLVRVLEAAPVRDTGWVHGDWHLGQLARTPQGWRLLDVEDLGFGDGAWDLGRPAGFWAAGLLADEDWSAFLSAYRSAGGPGVPPVGDPWPVLDLPARCAVFVAAARAVRAATRTDGSTLDALLAACARMEG